MENVGVVGNSDRMAMTIFVAPATGAEPDIGLTDAVCPKAEGLKFRTGAPDTGSASGVKETTLTWAGSFWKMVVTGGGPWLGKVVGRVVHTPQPDFAWSHLLPGEVSQNSAVEQSVLTEQQVASTVGSSSPAL